MTRPSPARRPPSRKPILLANIAWRRCTTAVATSWKSARTCGAGVGLARGGAGTALVGDAATVAERINEYAELGIDSFIFSGYPHLEEAWRVGELLFPLLDVNVPTIPQPQNLRLQGEAVANEFIPRKAAQS